VRTQRHSCRCSGRVQTRRAPALRQVLCLGLAAALAGGGGAAWRGAPAEVATALLGAYVGGRENDGLVLRRLWADAGGREAVLRALAAAREAEPKAALRALHVFQARARPTVAAAALLQCLSTRRAHEAAGDTPPADMSGGSQAQAVATLHLAPFG
jgi:hypothetical protein